MSVAMEIDAPYESPPMRVLPEWIDYNGHMNLGFYLVAFELAQTHFYDEVLDLSRAYGERTGHAAFALETHINYLSELHEGDPLRVPVPRARVRRQAGAQFSTRCIMRSGIF